MKTPQHQCWKGITEYFLTEQLKKEMVQYHIKECKGCFDVFHNKTENHILNPALISSEFKSRIINRKPARVHES